MSTVSFKRHQPAVADHGRNLDIGFVVQRHVPLRFRQIGAQGAAHLHGAQGAPRSAAAAEFIEQVTQAQPESLFHQPALFQVAAQLEGQRAVRTAHAVVAVVRRALGHDDRHRGQRDHVVDDGGLAEQARDGGQRRLGAHHAAFAFQAFQQGGFLAADIGARARAHFQVELAAAAMHVAAQPANAARPRMAASSVAMACGYSERT